MLAVSDQILITYRIYDGGFLVCQCLLVTVFFVLCGCANLREIDGLGFIVNIRMDSYFLFFYSKGFKGYDGFSLQGAAIKGEIKLYVAGRFLGYKFCFLSDGFSIHFQWFLRFFIHQSTRKVVCSAISNQILVFYYIHKCHFFICSRMVGVGLLVRRCGSKCREEDGLPHILKVCMGSNFLAFVSNGLEYHHGLSF